MTRVPSPAVLRSQELDAFLKSQNCDEKIRKWIDNMEAVLKENMYAGTLIKKKHIPSKYIQRYGVNNLSRYRHAEGYRSCYTILHVEGIGRCPIILDIMPHDEYDRIFGYRKK